MKRKISPLTAIAFFSIFPIIAFCFVFPLWFLPTTERLCDQNYINGTWQETCREIDTSLHLSLFEALPVYIFSTFFIFLVFVYALNLFLEIFRVKSKTIWKITKFSFYVIFIAVTIGILIIIVKGGAKVLTSAPFFIAIGSLLGVLGFWKSVMKRKTSLNLLGRRNSKTGIGIHLLLLTFFIIVSSLLIFFITRITIV